jgi:transposase
VDHADLDSLSGDHDLAALARLRRENAELAMERDVLKRSVALWFKGRDGL